MKKLLALALALLMVLGSTVAIFADDATTAEAAYPYQSAIDALKALKVFHGNGEGDGADDLIERYQMALFIGRALTGEVDDSYWGSENYTTFADIGGDYAQYAGAITMVFQKGIIIGTTSDGKTFEPASAITFQDALTMACRALGYTGLAYPSGYTAKAKELGLMYNISGVAFTDELTRGETAQIIYNMLYAEKSEGSNLINDVFDLKIVVITATDDNKFQSTDKTHSSEREGYLSFMELSNVNLYDLSATTEGQIYSLPASEFGIEPQLVYGAGDEEAYESYDYAVGYSFLVTSYDDYESISYVSALNVPILWNTGKTNDDEIVFNTKGLLEVGDSALKLVAQYSDLHNNQGTWTGKSEIIVYNPSSTYTVETVAGNYLYDSARSLNILALKDGAPIETAGGTYQIALYWNAWLNSYFAMDADGNFRVATDADFKACDLGYKTASYGYFAKTSKDAITARDAYASLELIDDNFDGEADRGIYRQYALGYYSEGAYSNGVKYARLFKYTGNTPSTTDSFDVLLSDIEYSGEFAADFAAGDYKAGQWVIYYYNAQTKQLDVIDLVDVETGKLEAFNVANQTMTIDGVVKTCKYADLDGTQFRLNTSGTSANNTKATGDYLYGLYRKYVNYIELDGEIVMMELDAASTGGILVVEEYLGLTLDGYIEVWAYTTNYTGLQKVLINSVDSWYLGYLSSYYSNTAADIFAKGTIFGINSVDSNGYYNLATSPKHTTNLLTYTKLGLGYFDKAIAAGALNNSDTLYNLKATADTYLIAVCGLDDGCEIITSKGIPTTDSYVGGEFYWVGSTIVVAVAQNRDYDYMIDGFNSSSTTTFIYIPASYYTNSATINSMYWGSNEYTYYNVRDLVTGDMIAQTTITNVTDTQLLKAGYVYKVVDGKAVKAYPAADVTGLIDAFEQIDTEIIETNTVVFTYDNDNARDIIDVIINHYWNSDGGTAITKNTQVSSVKFYTIGSDIVEATVKNKTLVDGKTYGAFYVYNKDARTLRVYIDGYSYVKEAEEYLTADLTCNAYNTADLTQAAPAVQDTWTNEATLTVTGKNTVEIAVTENANPNPNEVPGWFFAKCTDIDSDIWANIVVFGYYGHDTDCFEATYVSVKSIARKDANTIVVTFSEDLVSGATYYLGLAFSNADEGGATTNIFTTDHIFVFLAK